MFLWAADRYDGAGAAFADEIEGMELAVVAEQEHLTQNAEATAAWADKFRELAALIQSDWDGLARSIIFAVVGFCLGTAVFQFAFVNWRRA